MTRREPPAKKGSKKWIQQAVNHYPGVLYDQVAPQLQLKHSKVKWLSPLRNDKYAEYRDQKFIDRLGLKLNCHPLKSFWPSGGPHWDALAKTGNSQSLLVEAKSYIGEMSSSKSKASCQASIEKISCSLKETQKFLDANQTVDWTKYPHYQYANRLAHLYLLAELNCIDAYLLMIYFLHDVKMKGPNCIREWEEAVFSQHEEMGLAQSHRMSERIINIYISVHDLGE